ncbi:hypothetical protein QJS04_geneDACA001666 [Acorus gramineus]|uniref:Uncharacterized protein n=1 Tax=Acorus gramineus TaxID=55184 RepID=A0AAV9BHA9_ACOGR|nr:hypothetical protein QJS04_geneDACA001666 [Acorus gramineus]
MAWRCGGSISRSLISARSTASSSIRRPSPPSLLPRLRPSSLPTPAPPRLQSRRLSFTPSRSLGELACLQSLLPLHSVVSAARLTSHLSVEARACCELSQGTFRRTCQDR